MVRFSRSFLRITQPIFIAHSVPQVLVLNDCGIDQAGPSEDLKKKCNTVKELDLAQNKLENWNEVSFGSVKFFNASVRPGIDLNSAPDVDDAFRRSVSCAY